MEGYFSNTDLKNRWWLHRDQKMFYDPSRDAPHVKLFPNAFDLKTCFQSSLYFEDSINIEDDSFICCPGSHNWEDGKDWISAHNRHNVSVPYDDDRIKNSICKLIIKKGEMIVWNSKIAHMGGFLKKKSKNGYPIKMVRLVEHEPNEHEKIKNTLENDGVVLITHVISNEEINSIYKQFCLDISQIYDIDLETDWKKYPDFVFGRENKGGGSWGVISCSKSAWDSRLIEKRVKIFENLLNSENLCVSIDSLHINKNHNRFSSMASFCDKSFRPNDALIRKAMTQIHGVVRTTHWANMGQFSTMNYGAERNSNPHKRYKMISKNWKGHGCITDKLPFKEILDETYAKRLSHVQYNLCLNQSFENMIDPEVLKWL